MCAPSQALWIWPVALSKYKIFKKWILLICWGVTRLRRKIEADPARPVYLRTVWGEGYLFSPRGAAPQ